MARDKILCGDKLGREGVNKEMGQGSRWEYAGGMRCPRLAADQNKGDDARQNLTANNCVLRVI